eukprot:TRINITY_DN9191_c0_g1_i2.p1 TRINITY_DN9191_c0_g1~~TRINITY_DN9191_c0_g1_i2.p1  ORF type:complete len:197 (-),score=4.38 TRINITY_DN9191_c0_g1_i2:152-742(-)
MHRRMFVHLIKCTNARSIATPGAQYVPFSAITVRDMRDKSFLQSLFMAVKRDGPELLDPVIQIVRRRVFSLASSTLDSEWLVALLPHLSTQQLNVIVEEVHRRLPAMALHDIGHSFCLGVVNSVKSPYQMRLVGVSIVNKIHVLLAQSRGHIVLQACLRRFPNREAAPIANAVVGAVQMLHNSASGVSLLSAARMV